MKTKTALLTFALPLAVASVQAHAQQSIATAATSKGVLTSVPVQLKAPAPRGCANWVTDGVNGLSILDKRAAFYKQQLLEYKSASLRSPKDKKLSREEYESVKKGELKLKSIEHEMKCDAVNRHALRKENLGWDKNKETEAARVQHETAANISLEEMERTRREVMLMLQQIMEAQAKANRDVASKM